jgi:hypothetical protein
MAKDVKTIVATTRHFTLVTGKNPKRKKAPKKTPPPKKHL